MWFSFGILVLSVGVLIFFPLQYLLLTIISIFGLLVWYELYKNRLSLLDLSIFFTYGIIGIVYYFFRYENIIPFTGSIVYGVLSVTCFLSLLMKNPFTMGKRNSFLNKEDSFYKHMFLTGLLCLVFVLSLFFSVYLFPNSTYIYVPLLISTIGSAIMLYLGNFIWIIFITFRELQKIYHGRIFSLSFNKRNVTKGKIFIRGEKYTIKLINLPDEERIFLSFLKKVYLPIYLKSKDKDKKSYDEFFDTIEKEYEEFKKESFIFLSFENTTNKVVGCVRFVFSEEGKMLPLEKYLNISLEPMRAKGIRICEVGRMAVLPEGISKGEIFAGLGSLFLLLLVSKGIDVVFNDSVGGTKVIYQKAGFNFLEEEFYDKETLQKAYLGFFTTPSYLQWVQEKMLNKKELVVLLFIVYRVNFSIRKILGRLKINMRNLKDKNFILSNIEIKS